MTVADHIDLLRKQPQQAEVMLDHYGGLVPAVKLEVLPEDDTTLLLVIRAKPEWIRDTPGYPPVD